MFNRRKVSRRKSRKMFSKSSRYSHKKNRRSSVMVKRGGYRI